MTWGYLFSKNIQIAKCVTSILPFIYTAKVLLRQFQNCILKKKDNILTTKKILYYINTIHTDYFYFQNCPHKVKNYSTY